MHHNTLPCCPDPPEHPMYVVKIFSALTYKINDLSSNHYDEYNNSFILKQGTVCHRTNENTFTYKGHSP